nr:MAG TPA: hypothetical protein [Caudoviricetes sp.]
MLWSCSWRFGRCRIPRFAVARYAVVNVRDLL